MGKVVPFGVPIPRTPRKPKRKPEPQGWLMVPARALNSAKRLQDSLDRCVFGDGAVNKIDWRAIYELLAMIDHATVAPGGGGERNEVLDWIDNNLNLPGGGGEAS
jgi:hypothetical protein